MNTIVSNFLHFFFNRTIESCDNCPIGWYQQDEQMQYCLPCIPGLHQPNKGGKKCQHCPSGKFQNSPGNETCQHCKLGETTSTTGAASCEKCDLGKYGSTKGTCLACPAGQYQDGKGEISCKECGANTYLIESGKSSNADCVGCPADKSTGITTGNTMAAACLCKRTDYYQNDKNECEPCPTGADCSKHDGLKLSEVFALPGYYRLNNEKLDIDTTFIPCSQAFTGSNAVDIAKQRCCPLQEKDSNTSTCSTINASSNPNLQCQKG